MRKQPINDVSDIQTYSVPEIAKIFGASDRTAYKWVRSGRIQAVKIAGSWRVSRAEVERATNEGLRDPVEKEGEADGSEQR